MNPTLRSLCILATVACSASAQPGLTIYNGRFAVVRDSVPLELKAGENVVRYSGATASLEPSSVILRDPAGKVPLSILEQNYRNDPVSEQGLLERYEDQPQTVSFLVREPQKPDRIVEGRVIRSGFVPGGTPTQPIIEVDGKLMFELPGRPLFAGLKDDNILKPQLTWRIQSPVAAQLQAELAYLTGGLEWEASYNFVLPETGESADLNGWVTLQNHSGKLFENAKIKLMAGDIHRAPDRQRMPQAVAALALDDMAAKAERVTEKAFDDFHLYELPRPTTLRDQETKQLEFTRAASVPTKRIYSYDGAPSFRFMGHVIVERDWMGEGNTKVESVLEFQNNEASQLGIPLPAGNIRVYRKDGEQLEFVGEDRLEHTARNETVRVKLGNAFDLVGERKRTNFKVDSAQHTMEESFEVRVRNQSKRAVEIRVIEHLARATNWTIADKNKEFRKVDSETVQFTVPVASEKEGAIKYTVRYTW